MRLRCLVVVAWRLDGNAGHRSVLTALIKRRIDEGRVTILTSQYSMTDALAGVAKKQDAEAISRRIHEKGAVYVFERRREHRVP